MYEAQVRDRVKQTKPRISGGNTTATTTSPYTVTPAYKLHEVRCQGRNGRCNRKLGEFERGTKGYIDCSDSRCGHKNKIEVK